MTVKRTYEASECGHENVLEFGDESDVFEARTLGCNTCGTTSEHVLSDNLGGENEGGEDDDLANQDGVDEEAVELMEEMEDVSEGDDTKEALDPESWVDDANYFDDLQPVAQELGIAANQSADDIREAITDEDPEDIRRAIQVVEVSG